MSENNWTYGQSDLLRMKFAFKQKSDGSLDVYTEDKTYYTQKELNIMHEKHNNVYDKRVHIIKHMFEGEIVG